MTLFYLSFIFQNNLLSLTFRCTDHAINFVLCCLSTGCRTGWLRCVPSGYLAILWPSLFCPTFLTWWLFSHDSSLHHQVQIDRSKLWDIWWWTSCRTTPSWKGLIIVLHWKHTGSRQNPPSCSAFNGLVLVKVGMEDTSPGRVRTGEQSQKLWHTNCITFSHSGNSQMIDKLRMVSVLSVKSGILPKVMG